MKQKSEQTVFRWNGKFHLKGSLLNGKVSWFFEREKYESIETTNFEKNE